MAIIFSVLLVVALYLLASRYFDFAFVDTHKASRPPRWLVRGYACLLVVLVLIASRTVDVSTETASNALMTATGLLFGPALAPPFRSDPARHPTWTERLRMALRGMASGAIVKKVFAFVLFAISLLIGVEWWIFLAFGIASVMLYSKTMFLVSTRQARQEGEHATKMPSGGWAIVCFVLLVALVPYTLSAEIPLEPASWAGFVGLGLSALLPDLIN